MVEEYLEQEQVSGRSENHIYSLRTVAEGIFFPQLGGGTPIQDFDYAKNLLPFLKWLQDTPTAQGKARSPVTCNKYGNFLKTFFNYAVMRGYLKQNPMSLWRKQYEPRKQRLLTTEDIKKIIANAAPHLQWAMEVAYNTGARTGESELLSLKWSDVDYEKKLLHIFARKTKTDRWVPLSDDFIQRLRQQQAMSTCEYIISYQGQQVKNMHKAFRTACKKAGIEYEVRMYDIRHLFASELFAKNVSVGVVSRLIGHSRTSTTTDVYLEVLPKEIFEVRDKLPSLDLPMAENQ